MNKKFLAALAVMCLASEVRAWETLTAPCALLSPNATVETQEAWDAYWTNGKAPEVDFAKETVSVSAADMKCTFMKMPKVFALPARSAIMGQAAGGFPKMENKISMLQAQNAGAGLFDGSSNAPAIQSLDMSGGPAKKKDRIYRVKDYILPATAMFASGFLDGTIESISYHYDNGFKKRFPNANDQYWDPKDSWRNKYQNGDPAQGPKFMGSTTMFVSATDAYHSLRAGKRAIDMFTLVYYINDSKHSSMTPKQRLKKTLIDALILTAVRGIGFTASYDGLFKAQK